MVLAVVEMLNYCDVVVVVTAVMTLVPTTYIPTATAVGITYVRAMMTQTMVTPPPAPLAAAVMSVVLTTTAEKEE